MHLSVFKAPLAAVFSCVVSVCCFETLKLHAMLGMFFLTAKNLGVENVGLSG
jgi:hypothetical protein